MLSALPGLGYAGLVVEGMGLGHVPAEVAPILGELTTRIPVVLASRVMTCPVFTRTYGYPGSEIDLIARSVVPAGYLSGLKARLLVGFTLRPGKRAGSVVEAFAPYK
jgi:L-asparaginase